MNELKRKTETCKQIIRMVISINTLQTDHLITFQATLLPLFSGWLTKLSVVKYLSVWTCAQRTPATGVTGARRLIGASIVSRKCYLAEGPAVKLYKAGEIG